MSVNGNDETAAVNVGYLEEGLLKISDKNNNKLFKAFFDFRRPDSYDTKFGGNGKTVFRVKKSFENFNLSKKEFTIDEYQGKEGIKTRALGATFNPSPSEITDDFVFIGLLKPGTSFSFKSPQKPELIMKYDPPFFKSEYGSVRKQVQVNDTFKNKSVILLFSFHRFGTDYKFLGDDPQYFILLRQADFNVSEFMASFPQNSKEKIKIKFLGHVLFNNDLFVGRFLMEEKYRK